MKPAVHYFVVADGTRISRLVHSLGTVRRILKRVRRLFPGAYAMQETILR